MKKGIFIAIILIIGGFFTFFEINFESENSLDFMESYKTEIGFSDFEAEKIISTDKDEDGLRITFIGCLIDTTNFKNYGGTSKKIAIDINKNLNKSNEFNNITLIFKPSNNEGIKINEMMSIDELKFNYKAEEL